MTPAPTRRDFLRTTLLASAALALPVTARAAQSRLPLIGFTKPFQELDPEQTAETVAAIGWSGVELAVRKKGNGQVVPERVEEDLPKYHEALQKRSLTLPIITTEIWGTDATAEKVLRTAAALGVKKYRLGFRHYDLTKPIAPQVANHKAILRDVAAMNQSIGVFGGIQNHSGNTYIGGPIWDIFEFARDLPPGQLGVCYDISHSTIEGGLTWQTDCRLMEPYFTCIFVKDAQWSKGARGGSPKWCPLGEGVVDKEFFTWLNTTAYDGPISMHTEYLEGSGPEQITAMRKDIEVLNEWLGRARV